MPLFSYTARSISGQIRKSAVEAADQKAALLILRDQKLIVTTITEKRPAFISAAIKKIRLFNSGINAKDLALFSREFSTLVSSGIPIVQGLSILVEQARSKEFKNVLRSVREDIVQGVSITEAMQKHPEAFSQMYISMIKAGEVGGILDTILERLSGYLESAEELRGKVVSALVYPLVISLVAAGVTTFLLIFVIPTFKNIFDSFGAELPIPTRILIGLSFILRKYFFLILAVPVILFIVFQRWRKTDKGSIVVDTLLLKIPVFGTLLKKVAIAKFARTFGTLIKSGVPILQVLDTVQRTSGNRVIEVAVEKAKRSIREGERMAEPLRQTGIFPSMVIQMMSVGEETGTLDAMLEKVADFYDQEVDTAIRGLTSLLEPLIMVGMGLVIGGIVISMFLPVFELGQIASKAG